MAGKSQTKLVNPPGAIESAMTCSPTTWSYCDRFRWHLPKIVIVIGVLFLIIGIIVTVLSHTDKVDYTGGYTAGPVLMVLGTVMIVGGILWILFRAAYSSSYSTQNKGYENPSYANNEGARVGVSNMSSSSRPGIRDGAGMSATVASPEDVQIVIGYVPTQKEDWMTGDIYKPQVIH